MELPGIGDGVLHRLLQKSHKVLRLGRQTGVPGLDPAQADGPLARQGHRHHPGVRQTPHQKAAAGGEGVGGGQQVHGGGAVVDTDAPGGLFEGPELVFLREIHRCPLVMLKGQIGEACQIRHCHRLQARQGMPFADVEAGGHGGQLVKLHLVGVQHPADDFLRQVRQEDDPQVHLVLVHILDHHVHPRLLDGEAEGVFIASLLDHAQKGVLRKGVALGGHGKAGRGNGSVVAVKALDALLLLQKGHGVAEELLALGGELHAPVAAAEKADAQLVFQLPDGGGDARLGQKELVGRLVDGPAPGHLHQIGQLLKCHCLLFLSLPCFLASLYHGGGGCQFCYQKKCEQTRKNLC